VFGAGVDHSGNALVMTDGSARWGPGAISAQWISSSGEDLTGEFLLLTGFHPETGGRFETSALEGGGVAVRQVNPTDLLRREVTSRYLCMVGAGSRTCDAPPEWLSSRRNVRIEAVRNGAAYAVLPDPALVSDCMQTVELIDGSGASCGSIELRMTHGSCRTRKLALGKDGTLIQPLANEAWQCGPPPRSCRATWRWWPRIFR
jgi:hypothetical protein